MSDSIMNSNINRLLKLHNFEVAMVTAWTFPFRLGEMLHVLRRYVLRDPSYTILARVLCLDGHRIWYRYITISPLTGDLACRHEACYEMAHETIHLLEPSVRRMPIILNQQVLATMRLIS